MIDFKEVSYQYNEQTGLDHISFHVEKGESVCLIGPNGSGKSTLLKILNGLIFPCSGTYKFENEKITRKKLDSASFSKHFHQKIGYVFQNADVQLFCSNVYEEIAFGPQQMGLSGHEIDKRVKDCLRLLDIEHLAGRVPYHLSGGEKRKVALACILALNPDVVVLDEPMAGLTLKAQKELMDLLIGLNRSGKTLITSTHHLNFARIVSRRVLVFDESHQLAGDMAIGQMAENRNLFKKVNLIYE